MQDVHEINILKDQSTWKLFFLGVITYGVYFAYYAKKQTIRLNELLSEEDKISIFFLNFLIALAYITLFLFITYFFVDEGSPLDTVGVYLDYGWSILMLVWGFMAKNRVNQIFGFRKSDSRFLKGIWIFLFSTMYFNYKINKICDQLDETLLA